MSGATVLPILTRVGSKEGEGPHGGVTELKYTEYKFSHFQVCNSVAFSTFTVLCNHHFYLVPKNFHHHQIGSVKQFLPIPHFPESLETVNLLSISMGLFILDISYKWTHTIYDLLCLPCFT